MPRPPDSSTASADDAAHGRGLDIIRTIAITL
jgi:hypothetical protein